jgi:hypothetical protein
VSELPEELLWTILGLLDLRTLCTARLTCKHFRQLGAAHLKSLQLDCITLEQHIATDYTQFSGVTRLDVCVSSTCRLRLLTHPKVAPVITHVQLQQFSCNSRDMAEELAILGLLPKLLSLSVHSGDGDVCNLGLLPLGLEELTINKPSMCLRFPGVEDASPLSRLSKLASLKVNMALDAGGSVGFLSSLRDLHTLHVECCPSVFVPLSALPMLTSLTWEADDRQTRRGHLFKKLTLLTGLRRLKVSYDGYDISHEDLSCMASLSKLSCLDLCN